MRGGDRKPRNDATGAQEAGWDEVTELSTDFVVVRGRVSSVDAASRSVMRV